MTALNNTKKRGVVFMDRDGTLTKRCDLTWKKSQLRFQDGVLSFIKFLNKNKIPIIVITNQPVVARGLIDEKGVIALHNFLNNKLKAKMMHIDRFYFCPHHPEALVSKYRKKCSCRKPKIGLFIKAKKDFLIDFKKSFMIGDMTQDILAGNTAKIKTILLEKGHKGLDGKYNVVPNFRAKNFSEIKKIIKNHEF